MRMWYGVHPSLLCRQHLLGEHVEMHMFAGTLLKGRSIQGYLERGLVVPNLIRLRHDELVAEMKQRGMNHKSPPPNGFRSPTNNREQRRELVAMMNRADLYERCPHCRKRMDEQ